MLSAAQKTVEKAVAISVSRGAKAARVSAHQTDDAMS